MTTKTTHAGLIESEYKDSDGIWIKLRPGFQHEGLHYIHAETRAERAKDLRNVVPCDKTCDTCSQARDAGGVS